MDIWSDSYSEYGREQYYKAKEKADKELKKANLYIEIMNAQSDTIKQLAQTSSLNSMDGKLRTNLDAKQKEVILQLVTISIISIET